MKSSLAGFVCLTLLALGQTATRATEAAASPSSLLNVVLIEVDTTPEAIAAQRFEKDEWTFWGKAAPKLLTRLEGDLGCVQAGGSIGPEASLYGVRCAAASLDDTQHLRPLMEHLDGISKLTSRPSLLVVWMANQGCVLLALQVCQEQQATYALATLARVQHAHAQQALGVTSSAAAPPCVVVSGSPGEASQPNVASLDRTLRDSGIDSLSHCIVLSELQIASSEVMRMSEPDLAPGAEFRLETLQTNVDRFNNVAKTLYKIAGVDMPSEMKVPLAFAAPVMGDVRSAGQGTFHPLTSQSLERVGKFGMSELPKIIGVLETQGRLPSGYLARVTPFLAGAPDIVAGAASQVGRGAAIPTVPEVTHYLDGVNKACWATVGALVASPGGPTAMARGASIASTSAGLVADIARGQTYTLFENAALDPVRKQMVSDFRIHVNAAVGHGFQAKTFSEMFTPQDVSRLGFSPKLVAELDASARMANNSRALTNTNIRLPDRLPIYSDSDNISKFKPLFPPGGGGPPPPPGGGGAAVPNLDRIMRSTFPLTYGLNDPTLRSSRPTLMPKPGGILFHPELEVVPDESGLTASKAAQAVAAVKGKAGGEFRFEGQQYIAAKAPGTANLFQVTVGRFRVRHQDLSLRSSDGSTVELTRYYDSGSTEPSSLGQGWTFLPFSLRVGQTVKTGKAGAVFAKRPVLVDNERALEMAYQMEVPDGTASGAEAETELPQYRSLTSSFQPYLAARADGGYVLTYAHGLQAGFGPSGRLEWVGSSETSRVRYTFESGRLTDITRAGAKVSLNYDKSGRPSSTVGSDARRVEYVMDSSDRLTKVSGAIDGSFVFDYGPDNRLSTVQTLASGDQWVRTVENAYDSQGRMLSHRTPSGLWTFRYNDTAGFVVVTPPSGKDVSYYYDGKQQLIAYGSSAEDVTLFNYDVMGRVFQVAAGKLLNDTSTGERPRFKVTEMITPEI